MSFRHVVLTLAAAFFALAIGVVLGARLLSDPVVSGLRGDKGDLQELVDKAADQNGELNRRLDAADEFDAAMSARIVRDSLAGKSVLLVRTPDATDGNVEAITRTIGQAGGTVTGTITLSTEFVAANSAEKLRSVVNSPIVPPGAALNSALTDPGAQAGDLLGLTLLNSRQPDAAPVDDAARDTVLTTLRDTGFISYGDRVTPADTAVVVTGGALPEDAGNQGATVARFAAALATHGYGTVLAGSDGSATGVSAIAVARSDAALKGAVTTVDDAGIADGRITTVLALQSLISGAPPAHYGTGPGATAVTVTQP